MKGNEANQWTERNEMKRTDIKIGMEWNGRNGMAAMTWNARE